jgi:hypothetical protein
MSERTEREVKLLPPPDKHWTDGDICNMLAEGGIDTVSGIHRLEEKVYWDGRDVPLARRDISCIVGAGETTSACLAMKVPMAEPHFHREFKWEGEGPLDVFQDPLFWKAQGLTQVGATFASRDELSAFIGTFGSTGSKIQLRRMYFWLTNDEVCSRGDYFANDACLTFDRVQPFAAGRALDPYVEVEIELAPWSRVGFSGLVERTTELLVAQGFRHASVSKYRRLCLAGGLCE